MGNIKPALTAEQWQDNAVNWNWATATFSQHAVAAMCLYGRPFGFTREDVAELRRAGEVIDVMERTGDTRGYLNALADRIEALLPPEKK